MECSLTFLQLLETPFIESPGIFEIREISRSLWNFLD